MQDLRLTSIHIDDCTVDVEWTRNNAEQPLDPMVSVRQIERAAQTLMQLPLDQRAHQLSHMLLETLEAKEVEVTFHQEITQTIHISAYAHAAGDEMPTPADHSIPVDMVSHRAIIAMESSAARGEEYFREAIVSLDSIPGNNVEGISPLYHVSNFDSADSMTAVVSVSTTLNVTSLARALDALAMVHEAQITLRIIDMDNVDYADPHVTNSEDSAMRAAVLSPWLDMDPQAQLDGNPLAFLLASAPDSARVGMLSDNWIIGGAL